MSPPTPSPDEATRETLRNFAVELHELWGMSPRPDLAPDEIVKAASERPLSDAVPIPAFRKTYPRFADQPDEVLNYLRAVENVSRERWNNAWTEYRRMLTGYCRVRWSAWGMPPKSDIETIVQGAWVDAYNRRAAFRGTSEGQYIVWLRWIVEGHAGDVRDQMTAGIRDWKRENQEDSATRLDELLQAVNQLTPSATARREELNTRMCGAIESLPEPRRTIMFRVIAGETDTSTMKLLGLTLNEFRRERTLAYGTLRRALEGFE